MAVAKGRLGAIFAPTSVGTNATATGLTEIGGLGVFYVTTGATRRVISFDPDAVITDFNITDFVGLDNVLVTAVNHARGHLEFSNAGGAPWTFTSTNNRIITLANIAGFSDWSITGGPQSADITEFGDSWIEQVITLKDWSATATSFWQDSDFTLDAAAGHVDIDDAPFTVKFFMDSTEASYEAFVGKCIVTGFDITTPVAGVVTKTINFVGVGELAFDDYDPTT